MGWMFCGNDSQGRDIGYGIEAVCDEEGCDSRIDRGLGYACGGMHGKTDVGCEKYFCEKHLPGCAPTDEFAPRESGELPSVSICKSCYNEYLAANPDEEERNGQERGAVVQD